MPSGQRISSVASSQIVEVKEVAFGTTAAILLDATLVRCLLVPALMRLLRTGTGGRLHSCVA